MNIIEAVAEITKSAIENKSISLLQYNFTDEEKDEIEKQNAFNAKQIADFISVIAEQLNK